MSKLRRSFSLRSLLIVVALVALYLGYWRRSQDLRNQAAEYHLEALKSGYLAVRMQKPQSVDWEHGWRNRWIWPSPLAMDRNSVLNALPLWQQSIESDRKSQICLYASNRPWLFWSSPVTTSQLKPLPTDDDEIGSWWDTEIATHVETLGLNQAYAFGVGSNPSHVVRDCVFQNGADQSIRRKFDWCEIRSIMPVEDGYNDKAEQSIGHEALDQPF